MYTWQGKTAFITGGGSGIGRGLARALANRGVHVCVTDINFEAAQTVAKECGENSTAVELDVRDAQQVSECIRSFVESTSRLDLLFNNAGIGVSGESYELADAHWNRIIDINIRGVVNGVTAAYPIMVQQGFGHIINTASLAGLGPAPFLTSYTMTKHAIVGLSTSLRIEAATLGVRVSVLCPAAIETPLLDSDNPSDLPKLSWVPNIRQLLTKIAGPAYPVEKLVTDTLAAIKRNVGIIVVPRRARFLWRLGRLLPIFVEKIGIKVVADERALK